MFVQDRTRNRTLVFAVRKTQTRYTRNISSRSCDGRRYSDKVIIQSKGWSCSLWPCTREPASEERWRAMGLSQAALPAEVLPSTTADALGNEGFDRARSRDHSD